MYTDVDLYAKFRRKVMLDGSSLAKNYRQVATLLVLFSIALIGFLANHPSPAP